MKSDNKSGYKGVHWDKRWGKWRAHITANGKRISLGYFDDKEAAAMAYNSAAIIHIGNHAVIGQSLTQAEAGPVLRGLRQACVTRRVLNS